jgi:hypothetical protein
VTIERPDETTATYSLTFQTELEVASAGGGLRRQEAGYTVIRYDQVEGYCDAHILLADRNAILLAVGRRTGWTGTADMCEIIDAAQAAVLARLAERGIGTRPPLSSSPLAGIPSCSLLTADDLSAVIPDVSAPRSRFGDWGCDWSSYSGDGEAELVYYRTVPLDAYPGTPADFAGRPGLVHPEPGLCWVPFVQRSYTVDGSDRIETVQVTYEGPGTDAELCRAATALAMAAARRLPARS